MNVTPQKAMAARILKCGVGRVWINQDNLSDVSVALTRDDINKLIVDGLIRKKPIQGVSLGLFR